MSSSSLRHASAPRPPLRTVLALSVLVLSAAALAVPPAGSGASTPLCATGNLRLDFAPPPQAATGHRFWDLTLRNVGPATCHLKGYPGVGVLDAHARLININVARQTGFQRRLVTLHTWQRAWFSFVYTTGAFCPGHSRAGYGIQVIPPNNTSRLVYYSGRFSFCVPPHGNLGVYPVRPSRSPL